MRLYLASTSPARLSLLRAAGIEPATISPEVDEDAVAEAEAVRTGAPLTPHHVVELLARAKAEAVAADGAAHGIDGLILGGDSVFVLDGVIYGKPHTPERARERWQGQRGRTGQLFSGHWLIEYVDGKPGRAVGAVAQVCRRHPGCRARRLHRDGRTPVRGGRLHHRQSRRAVHHPDRGRPVHGGRAVAADPAPVGVPAGL